MENVIEFIGNHTMMVVAWVFTLAMLIFTERMKGGKSVTAAEATRLINKEDAVVLDIRAHKDFSTGHLTNSINIPLADFDRRMSELDQYKEKPIIVVCNMGQTAGTACRKMKSAGFTQAMRLTGGISEWRHQSMPVVTK